MLAMTSLLVGTPAHIQVFSAVTSAVAAVTDLQTNKDDKAVSSSKVKELSMCT